MSNDTGPTLQTARCTLRPWLPEDAPALWQLIRDNHARFTRSFPKTLAAVRDEASAAAFIAERRTAWVARTAFQWGIWPTGNGQCAGFVNVLNLDWSVPRAELAYLLGEEFEGQGLLTEALPVVLSWAFAELGLARVSCRIWAGNPRSWRLVERIGFRHEGTLRHDFRDGYGNLADSELYGLLPTDLRTMPNPA